MWPVFVFLLVVGDVEDVEGLPRSFSYGDNDGGYDHYIPLKKYRDECMNPLLTCVPEDACVSKTPGGYLEGWRCPPNWSEKDGVCILQPDKYKIGTRTQAQMIEYCTALGAEPYIFQSSQEMIDFLEFGIKNDKDDRYYKSYWLDARWDDDDYRWEWLSNGEKIEWGKLLRGNCSKENQEVVDKEDGCLGMSLDHANGCIRIRKISCLIELPFFCKMGSYKSRCAESVVSDCCYSPTYDYYYQNMGPGSHTIHSTSKTECWILLQFNSAPIPCHEVLDIVGDLHPFPRPVRVGSSFYYFSHRPCLGERRAVVSSQEVHDFIVNYLRTEELYVKDNKYIIGLSYDPDDDEFHWENGKKIEYNRTFWAAGQPDKKGGIDSYSCVAYEHTDRNAYAWHLLPYKYCAGKSTVNVCELPIRSTNILPTAKKVECGQRLERGVLARSYYGAGPEHDDEEAQYGEFPWHVAVLRPSNYLDGVVMVFACSGVLVHRQYVLTSAHCLVYSGNAAYAVSLGEWDLSEDSVHVLDTMLVKVSDVIIHPGYKATGSSLHDLALLQLEEPVDVDSYPHVGLGCLPFYRLFQQQSSSWECFTVGWPGDKNYKHKYRQQSGEKQILQRIESDFWGRRRCRRLTRSYLNAAESSKSHGYDKNYGIHHLEYEHHLYFEDSVPELLCTEPFESHVCMDDPTPMLVCRKASYYTDDPFDLGSYDQGYGRANYEYNTDNHYKPDDHYQSDNNIYFANSKILNAYGRDRFDSDRWYIMGIGHSLNCKKHGIQVFTPVHEYLSFIHSHLDLQNSADNHPFF